LKKISIEGEKVPTLSEVLDFIFGENKIVDIELKNPNDLSSLVGLLKKTKLGDFYISSFYHNVIFTAKKNFLNLNLVTFTSISRHIWKIFQMR